MTCLAPGRVCVFFPSGILGLEAARLGFCHLLFSLIILIVRHSKDNRRAEQIQKCPWQEERIGTNWKKSGLLLATRKWVRLDTKHADVFYLHTPVCMSVFARVLKIHWSEQEHWNHGGVGDGWGSGERWGFFHVLTSWSTFFSAS